MGNDMKKYKTNRGFERINFRDLYGSLCSIQESSSVTETIWLGVDNNRMILDKKLSWKIVIRLLKFILTGKI